VNNEKLERIGNTAIGLMIICAIIIVLGIFASMMIYLITGDIINSFSNMFILKIMPLFVVIMIPLWLIMIVCIIMKEDEEEIEKTIGD